MNVGRGAHGEKIIPEESKELTEEKSYVLGVIGVGDGYIKYLTNKSNYVLGINVIDEEFASEFERCMETVYRLPCSSSIITYNNPNWKKQYAVWLNSKQACDDILTYGSLSDFKDGSEKIPKAIKRASANIKQPFLRAFFDSQSHVGNRYISGGKKNVPVLYELQKLLASLGIDSGVSELCGVLQISGRNDLEQYNSKIGFTIKRKTNALKKVLTHYSEDLSVNCPICGATVKSKSGLFLHKTQKHELQTSLRHAKKLGMI